MIAGTTVSYAIIIYNETDGAVLANLTGHTEWINDLKMIEDNFLASASSDTRIGLWNLSNYTNIGFLSWHSGYVNCLETFPGNIHANLYRHFN